MGRRANGGKGRLVVKLLPRLVLIRRHVCQYAGIIKQQKMHKERRRGDVARKNKHRRDVLAIYLYVPLLCSHRIKACPGSVEWTMEDGTTEEYGTIYLDTYEGVSREELILMLQRLWNR